MNSLMSDLETIKINNNLRHDSCPLCKSYSIINIGKIKYSNPLLYSSSRIEISSCPELWNCSNCNSSFTQNAIREEDSRRLYSQGSSNQRWSSQDLTTTKTKDAIACLSELFAKGGYVLDIGCNTGELLDFAKKFGCETHGVEYSQSSLEVLRLKGHVAYDSISKVDCKFDVITAFDLVEHHYDVPNFLQECLAKLNPGGILVLLTGNIESIPSRLTKSKWWYVSFPEHIVFPSKRYFQSHTDFKVTGWIPTFAAPPKILKSLPRLLIREILMLRPDGRTWLMPDHVIVTLQSNK